MIIIDGPDGSGKSTLVEYIKKHSELPLLKPFYPKQNQLSYYLHSPAHYQNCYLERFYPSELVYPQFKFGRNKMQPWHQYLIEAGMMPFYPIHLFLRPSKETIYYNIKSRGDDYIDLDEIENMIYYYDEVMRETFIPTYFYDYKEVKDLPAFLNMVELHHRSDRERALKFQKFLSSGSNDEGSAMLIGDMPSNQSIGNGFIRAFISDTGSSEFLHKCLYDAGIYSSERMPYFTNWNKCEDNRELNERTLQEEIDLLKPRKIICLGKEVREQVGFGETIPHPAYIKRFRLGQYNEYIHEIKEKLK